MEEILHQLETTSNYETLYIMGLLEDKPSTNWCRISSIHSTFWLIPISSHVYPFEGRPTLAQSPCKVGTLPWTPKWRVDWGRRRSIRPRFENIWKTYGKSAWKWGVYPQFHCHCGKILNGILGYPSKPYGAIWGKVVLTGSGFTTNSSKKVAGMSDQQKQ